LRRLVIQGVQELYDSFYTTPWDSPEDRINRIVFIGEIFLTFSPEIIQFLLTFYLELFPFLLPPNITNAIVWLSNFQNSQIKLFFWNSNLVWILRNKLEPGFWLESQLACLVKSWDFQINYGHLIICDYSRHFYSDF
jgi:hypothetical protein